MAIELRIGVNQVEPPGVGCQRLPVDGEHVRTMSVAASYVGCSPRGRGTRARGSRRVGRRRFIPAWAGNTGAGGGAGPGCTGSSPRGRGTPTQRPPGRRQTRFIPAWAGNTHSKAAWPPTNAVHPRVGGEHTSRSTLTYRAISKLAIGTSLFRYFRPSSASYRYGHPGGKLDQLEPIEIHRHSTILPGSRKLVALISGCRPRQHPISIFDEFFNFRPYPFSNTP